ncbi:transglycosylase domain-containing protein [Streptomyces sp. NPDC050703]|uniref:transglycosylase domain-containing protein n=1 Tax=Streptomyces sp. NPDC050703 TaxID=3157218 RepID=UPI00341A46A0
MSVDIPDENAAARREANVYYWSDGTQMVSTGEVNRQSVELDEIAPAAVNAVIAAENETFYDDSGVSLKGLGRAVVGMASGGETQGGSTITQQYVKNTYLSQDQTVTRKVKEFVIALKVDRVKSKEEILKGYLNSSWFGRGANGIEAAAHAYYGMSAKDLDPSRGALLAALLKGADLYDPAGGKANHRRAVGRWAWILDRQVDVGLMSERERARYRTFPEPRRQSRSTSLGGQTGYLVDVANKYLKQRAGLTDEDLARGGHQIHTTFDKAKVRRLEQAVRGVLDRDIDPARRAADRHVQIGAASVRPSDGAVVALYGGPDATEHFSNNADTSGVPVGSAFKPFVLAAALQRQSGLAGSRYAADGSLRPASGPSDPDRPTLREALYPGGNATYVRLGKDVGHAEVRGTAVAAGLLPQSMAEPDSAFPVGTSTPSAIRMATAYGTFASGGTRHAPYSVTKVVKDGTSLPGLTRPAAGRALDPEVAREVADALRVGAKGFAPGVSAGRTGDQDRLRTAWFTGFTKDLSTAVTLFRLRPDEPRLLPLSGVGGEKSRRGNTLPPRVWGAYTGLGPK